MRKLFDFENLSISLGNQSLFDNINFSISEGDRYMLLGKNGSGKSLLLELMFGGYTNEICKRYRGLKVCGHIWNDKGEDLLDPSTSRKIAYVTQNEDFHNNATFLSEGITACRGIGIDFDEDKFDALLKRFDLLEKKKQKIVHNVSCGEGKVIHLITRILKMDATDILLLDEPLNHLSFQNSKTFNDVIEEIKEKNPRLTVVMISHCRAISFVDKIMKYDYEAKEMKVDDYKSYNCFSVEDCVDICR